MSVWSDGLDAIYDSDIATDGVFSFLTESVRVIDKTAGVDLSLIGAASMPTVAPAACVRRSTLTDAGITNLADLINATVTLNGATWKITNHHYRPQPDGELAGEVWLVLRRAA